MTEHAFLEAVDEQLGLVNQIHESSHNWMGALMSPTGHMDALLCFLDFR